MNTGEKTIEKKVCDYAVKRGCYVRKFTSPARRGVPDRLFITPHGRVFFIEFKSPTGSTTVLQQRELRAIRERGVSAFEINSYQGGVDRVNEQIDIDNAV